MTLEQFNLSNDSEQALAVCDGVCVAGRDEGEYKVLLYQLKRFYVEVFYHPGKKLITQYKGFEDLEYVEKYLEKINLALAF